MTTSPTTLPIEQSRNRLLSRLRAVRRTGAIAALLAGSSQVLLTVLATVLVTIWLDCSLRMPGPMRLAFAIALLLIASIATHRLVLRRLRLPNLSHIARQVQRDVDGPPDSLASGAEFALDSTDGPLAERTIALAADLSDQLVAARLVRWHWLLGWLSAAMLTTALLAGTWQSIGWWIERGLQRFTWPIVQADWPRRVQIVSSYSTHEILTPPAEPVTLQARIVRGGDHVPATVVLAESDHVRRFEMTDAGDGQRTVTVRPIASGTFWFEAGDDSTADSPGRIRVIPRPQLTRAEILVQPPAYTGGPASRFALGSSPVRVPEGSRIDLTLSISKDLAAEGSDEGGRASKGMKGLTPAATATTPADAWGFSAHDEGERGRPSNGLKGLTSKAPIPMATIVLASADGPDAQPVEPLEVRFGSDHKHVTAAWWCRRDSLIRAEFADTDGLANAPLQPWRIVVQKDQLPTIEVRSPADNIEVAPTAVLTVQGQASDDWGIRDVQLDWQVSNAGAATQPARAVLVPASQPERMGDTVRAGIDQSWSLEPLALQPGDRVLWHLAVQDNFDLNGQSHEPVRSPVRTIRIISQAELLKGVLDQLAMARQQIAQLQAQQNDLSQALKAPDAAKQPADTLRQQATQQGQIAQQTRILASALAATAQRLQTNRIDRQDLAKAVESTATQLNRTQSREMARAQHDLQNAQAKPTGDQARSASVADAGQAADAAAKALEDLLHQTGAWTTVESAALGLQDLIARQQALRDQTRQVSTQTLGKSLDDLPGTQRQTLQDLAGTQRAMAEQLRRLQSDMTKQATAAEKSATSKPSSHASTEQNAASQQAAQLQQAADTLEKQAAVPAMAGGADELARNVTASAQQNQQNAQQAMEQALSALRGEQAQPQNASYNQQSQADTALAQRLKDLARQQSQLKDQTSQIHARRDPAGQLDRPGLIRLGVAGKNEANLAEQVGQAREAVPDADLQQALESIAGQMSRIAGQMQTGATDGHVQDAQQQAAEGLLAMADTLQKQSGSPGQNQGDSSQQNQANRGNGQPGASHQSKGGASAESGQSQQDQQNQQAGSSAGNRGRRGGSEGARDSSLPPDQQPTQAAALPSRIGQVEAWGFLPPDQRREVLQGMQAQPPARYRKLTERYWRVLNESVDSPETRQP